MFLEKRYNNAGFYVGLALYRTDTDNANNAPGWGLTAMYSFPPSTCFEAVPKKNWEIL